MIQSGRRGVAAATRRRTAPVTPPTGGTVLHSETFTGTDGAAWPAQWVPGFNGTGSSVTIQGNAGRLRTVGGTGYSSAYRVTRRLVETLGDFDAVVEFWTGDSNEKYPRLKWRTSDSEIDGVGGYEVWLQSNPTAYRATNYTGTSMGSATFAMTTGTHYWVRVRAVGSSHKVKFWSTSLASEPLTGGVDGNGYQIAFTDTTYTSGYFGFTLGIGNTSATRDFYVDNLSITSATSSGGGTTPDVMGPPSGVSLLHNLTTLAAWNQDENANVTQLAGPGPGGDPILRNTLVDGQRPSWDSTSNERSDLEGPNVPNPSTRWMTWWERIIELPSNISDGGFHLMGPNEIHGVTLPQATFQPMIGNGWTPAGTLGHKVVSANAGRAEHAYYDLGTYTLNTWVQWKMGIFYTQASNGWWEIWRDGVMLHHVDGATTTESNPGYWKGANYRLASFNGSSIYEVSGVRVYG